MQQSVLDTAFYDAMFNCNSISMNPLEEKALENVRNILNNPDQLCSHIPPLPVLMIQLMDELKNPNTDFEAVARLIDQDPSLAVQVLSVANSPLYSRSGKKIENLPTAIGRLGVQGVSSIATTIMMEKVRPQKPIYYKMFGQQIWNHSLQTAYLCKGFAVKLGEDEFSGHFLGLIHDVGKIIIFNCLTDALSSGIIDGQPGSKIFKDTMSEMSMDISSFVAREWDLPEKFCAALEQQRSGQESVLAKALKMANACAELYLLFDKKKINAEQLNNHVQERECNGKIWERFMDNAQEITAGIS